MRSGVILVTFYVVVGLCGLSMYSKLIFLSSLISFKSKNGNCFSVSISMVNFKAVSCKFSSFNLSPISLFGTIAMMSSTCWCHILNIDGEASVTWILMEGCPHHQERSAVETWLIMGAQHP